MDDLEKAREELLQRALDACNEYNKSLNAELRDLRVRNKSLEDAEYEARLILHERNELREKLFISELAHERADNNTVEAADAIDNRDEEIAALHEDMEEISERGQTLLDKIHRIRELILVTGSEDISDRDLIHEILNISSEALDGDCTDIAPDCTETEERVGNEWEREWDKREEEIRRSIRDGIQAAAKVIFERLKHGYVPRLTELRDTIKDAMPLGDLALIATPTAGTEE